MSCQNTSGFGQIVIEFDVTLDPYSGQIVIEFDVTLDPYSADEFGVIK